ncbi:hypothetical protein [Phosphitispora fastidiosa]|uniref:hypothetical protein n=1 Tax=Phosphitispora fastidiosa TaxID=2837202 RepID=UPI001E32DAC5|nr:hypothetical protein [Phosphitispora fastidiosa]MBU7008559.1 hypothetical protein [Phosphitispora fastidiosa]
MAESLGSLFDKLSILELKHWHSQDEVQLENISIQIRQIQNEINEYIGNAVQGLIPLEFIHQPSNKVYKKEGNAVPDIKGSIGEVVLQLAEVNCKLWHQQEKVYEFEKVEPDEKDGVIKQLAILNLERNKCIDEINLQFYKLLNNQKA